MKVIKILSTRRLKCGYEVRNELRESPCESEPAFEMKSAYNPNGDYIGNPKDANHLVGKRGIQPQLRTKDSSVCSIGYSVKDGKWYGWSHRAIFGFKIGSECKKGDCHYIPRSQRGKGDWIAKTTKDAKQMAMDFAEGVS